MNLTLDSSESGGAPSVPRPGNMSNREQQKATATPDLAEYSYLHSKREADNSDFRQGRSLFSSHSLNTFNIKPF